ncbi:50S ribosomal protein L24 [bacterium]|nr:50S ribosomal protein L24 [bacterium]
MSIFKGRYQTKPKPGDTTSRERIILDVRKDDEVMIMSGEEAGKKGKVLRTIPHKRQVVVQNLNYIWKHMRRTQQNPQGGRLHKEAPLPISKVAVVCPSCGEPTKIARRRADESGAAVPGGVRVCKVRTTKDRKTGKEQTKGCGAEIGAKG